MTPRLEICNRLYANSSLLVHKCEQDGEGAQTQKILANGTSLGWGARIRELLCGVINPKDNGFPVSSQPSCVSEKGDCLPSHRIHTSSQKCDCTGLLLQLEGRLLILLENKMIVLLCLPVKSSSPLCSQGLTADVCSTKHPEPSSCLISFSWDPLSVLRDHTHFWAGTLMIQLLDYKRPMF